ncbi:MAG: hypothetical protein JW910_02595 [Anaerolineae bacterium]|nr:hypothetical protein [Anaerolineae bacterium]
MSTLFRIHSDLRWLLVAVAVIAVIRLAVALMRRQKYDRSSRVLMLAFSILVDVQVAVGLVYFLWNGFKYDLWPRYRFEHLALMLVAAAIAHLPMRWKNAPDTTRTRNDLLTVIVAMAVIVVAVLVLPGGTDRWQLP